MCVLEILSRNILCYIDTNDLVNLNVNKKISAQLLLHRNVIADNIVKKYYPLVNGVKLQTILYLIKNHNFLFEESNIRRIEYIYTYHMHYRHFIKDWQYSLLIQNYYELFWQAIDNRIDVSNFVINVLKSYKIIENIFDDKLFYFLLYSDNDMNSHTTMNKIFRVYNVFDRDHIPVLYRLTCISIEWNRLDIVDTFIHFVNIVAGFNDISKVLLVDFLTKILIATFKSKSFEKIKFMLKHPLIYASNLRIDEEMANRVIYYAIKSFNKDIIKSTFRFLEEFENHDRLDFRLDNFNIGDDKNIIITALQNFTILKFILKNRYYKSGLFTQNCIIFKSADDIELLAYLLNYLNSIYLFNDIYYDEISRVGINISELKSIVTKKIKDIVS